MATRTTPICPVRAPRPVPAAPHSLSHCPPKCAMLWFDGIVRTALDSGRKPMMCQPGACAGNTEEVLRPPCAKPQQLLFRTSASGALKFNPYVSVDQRKTRVPIGKLYEGLCGGFYSGVVFADANQDVGNRLC